MYFKEKNRYELTSGQWKTRDDLLTYYTDLKEQRPELVSLENPFTDQVLTVFSCDNCELKSHEYVGQW